MTDHEFTDFLSSWAAVYGMPMHKEAVFAWRKELTQSRVEFDVACSALIIHSSERESARDNMRLVLFKQFYHKAASKLKAAVYLKGCAECEGTGYLHHVYGANGHAETLEQFIGLEYTMIDCATEKPKAHEHYRLCGIPCRCELGRELLAGWQRHPDGYPVEADVEALRACGTSPSNARGWIAYLQGHRDVSPTMTRPPARVRAPVKVGAGRVTDRDMDWIQRQDQEQDKLIQDRAL